MRRIAGWISKFFVLLFGELTWTRPGWLRRIEQGIQAAARSIWQHRKVTLPATLLVAAGGAIWLSWPAPKVEKTPDKIALSAKVVRPGIKAVEATENPTLKIQFDKSAAKIDQVGKAIDPEGIIRMEPEIEGTWRWTDDMELVFQPKEDWPIDQEYTVTINEEFLPEHAVFEQGELKFVTPPFRAGLRRFEFVSDPVDPERKTVVATLWFSHPVDRKSLEKRLSMYLGDPEGDGLEAFQYEVRYNKEGTEAYVHSHNIPIPMKDTPMKFRVEAGVAAAKGGPPAEEPMERTVNVPGMYTYFKVLGASIEFARNENNDPEQIIAINTKLDVHEKQIKKNFRAWLLPKDKPATKDKGRVKDYSWRLIDVDAELLKESEPLTLELVPQERTSSKMHTFKFNVPVKRQVYMKLAKGTKAWGGYVLADTFETVQRTPEYPKELAIMHEGAILSTNGARKLSVTSRGLPGVRIELARVMKSEVNHLLSQTSGQFEKPYFNYRFGPENIAQIYDEERPLDDSDPSRSQYTAIDFRRFIAKNGGGSDKGLFLLKVTEWNPNGYTSSRSDDRLVLITDLGIIVKRDAEDNRYVFVQSIANGGPKPGVEVAVLGKNGLPVIKARTDFNGLARFPSLKDFRREKQPVAFLVTAGDDFSYLPIGRSDRFVDYSRFDVGGVTTDGSSGTLSAFLFSDRGIYRPGDPFHVGLIVKAADWTQSVNGFPVALTVTDPRGRQVLTRKAVLDNNGFIDLEHATEESSPTGNYTVNAFLVTEDAAGKEMNREFLGSTVVRVEEFLPDAMHIKTAFTVPPTDGWISPENLAATVSLHNLYGTPATDRRVVGRVSLSTKQMSFKGYRDYRFHDPLAAEKGHVKALGEQTTDANGEARFDIDLTAFEGSTYGLTFMAEGFEAEGGRSVSSQSTITVSLLKHIVGYKADGGLRYLSRGAERNLRFIALNRRLEQQKVANLKAVLYERRYVSTLVKQYNGVFKYQSVPRKERLSKEKITIGKEGLTYPLKTDKAGEFILELAQGDRVVSTVTYSVAGAANLERNLERTAELEVKLDKSDYAPGEPIQVSIKAPYAGAGLITIERDKVFSYKWFKAAETSSVQTIQVPSGLDVNAYVNVTMARGVDSKEIFMSPFCTAVVPFSLTRENKKNKVELTVPELIKPGEELSIGYRTAAPSKIVVFAVDEGILQVAGYETPDPLTHFLSKRALEVSTSQILDLILPEYGVDKQAASSGGGDEEDDALGRNLNPFKRKREKPVVFWSGIIDAGPEQRTVGFTVPDYFNGTVRTMAVAVSMDRLGAAEQKTVVQGPFVIHASPPLFAAPGDTFGVSVTVANNVKGSGKGAAVKLSLDVTGNLEVVGSKQQAMKITEGREETARFELKAKARLGNATLTFEASHKGETITARDTLSIRPKNPRITTVQAGAVRKGKAEVTVKRRLYKEYRSLELSVSSLPLALADGLTAYLTEFPHGCTEQIVSQTVPAMVLRDHKAFGYDQKAADRAVGRTLRLLQARQNSEGGFGYWSANSYISDQQTVYAVQFLTEAKERGYPVSVHLLDHGLSYLKRLRTNALESAADVRLRAYAIYVLALNGELSARSLAALRERLDQWDAENEKKMKEKKKGEALYLFDWRRDVTVGYLAATYRLMQDTQEADALAKQINLDRDTVSDYEDFYDDQVYRGTLLHLLAKHFPDRLKTMDMGFISKIAKAIAAGRYNTLSSARLIYGLEAYTRQVEASLGGARPAITVQQVLSDKKTDPVKLAGEVISRGTFSEKARKLKITTDSDFPVFYQVSVIGFDLDNARDVPVSKGVEVLREYRTLDKKPVTAVPLGEEIEVVVRLRSTTGKHVSHLAIVDLLPAGFEVVLGEGYNRIGTPEATWSPTYADLREDRVLLYGHAGPKVQEFVYRIKATSRGEFSVPPAYLTSMYDPETMSRTASGTLRVTDPK